MDGSVFDSPDGWVSLRDVCALATLGVDAVRPSDRRAFPALEFRFDGTRCLLALGRGGDSVLEVGGRRVATFRYESSLATMRYRLVGWDDAATAVPRRAAAYMVAMQRCAAAEATLRYGALFAA